MSYSLPAWQDSPATSTPLSSAELLLYNSAINDIDTRINAKQALMTVASVQTGNYTANTNQFVPVNTTNSAIVVSFPVAPTDGTRVGVQLVTQGGSNGVTLQLGGSDKFNSTTGPTTATLTSLYQGAMYQYSAATHVWLTIAQAGGGGSVSSVTAGDSTITIGGTTSNPTVAVSAATLAAKAPTASPTFSGLVTIGDALAPTPVTLSGTSVTPDASQGIHFRLAMTAATTMNAPTNPTDGQKILFEITSGGAFTLTWNGIYVWGTDVTAPTLSQTSGKVDYVGFVYNAAASKWRGIAVARGY